MCVRRRETRLKIERFGMVYVQGVFSILLRFFDFLFRHLLFFEHSFYDQFFIAFCLGKGDFSLVSVTVSYTHIHLHTYIHVHTCMHSSIYTYKLSVFVFVSTTSP